MKTYLVDFENVKSKGLSGIDRLTEEDHVIIFYSENSDTISFEMHCLVMKTKAQVDYMKVRVGGKNALDFQLSTLLGYLVAKGDNTHLFIISNDKGFDKLHDFWENTFADSPDCKVYRTATIAAAVSYARGRKPIVNEEPAEAEEAAPVTAPEPAAVPAAAEAASEMVQDKTLEIEIRDASGNSSSIDLPEAMVYSMIDGTDFTESISPKPKADASKKRGRKPRAERADKPAEKSPEPQETKTDGLTSAAHPMIAADEAHMAMYEPMIEEFLARPEAKDKHALLAGFMEGVPDADIDTVRGLLIVSSSKLELHNMLMKQFDNETSTRYYTMVKKNYYFLKRVLPSAVAADTAQADKPKAVPASAEVTQTSEETAAQGGGKVREKKKPADKKKPQTKNADKQTSADKPAREKKQSEEKKEPDGGKTEKECKKVNAAMKRRLHELLDGAATPDEFSGVVSVINASATSQQLYINLMQRYSRARGRELYRLVKDAYAAFISGEAPTAEKKPRSTVKQKDTEVDDGRKRLRELTDGLINDGELDSVYEAVLEAATVHKLYLGLIRRFGRKMGAQIYSAIKAEHEVIKAALAREEQG